MLGLNRITAIVLFLVLILYCDDNGIEPFLVLGQYRIDYCIDYRIVSFLVLGLLGLYRIDYRIVSILDPIPFHPICIAQVCLAPSIVSI